MIGINKIIYEYNNKLLIINVGKKCSVIYNNINYDVDSKIVWSYLQSFTDIIFNWKDKYIDNTLLDSSKWRVVIDYIDFRKEYIGKGDYPNNFNKLEDINLMLINEVIK
ncbi:MAG: hypothetical protein PUA90_01555 [bacterium]|nr:hypothetical protein [bacterium]